MKGVCVNSSGEAELNSKTLLDGDCSVFAKNGLYTYTLNVENKGSSELNVTLIDVLPHTADADEAGNGDGRTPASSFSGTSVYDTTDLPDGASIQCTTADAATIDRDPEIGRAHV